MSAGGGQSRTSAAVPALSPADLVLTPTGLRFAGRRFPCTIGRGGLTDAKREGDGATPRAVMRVVGMLYRPDRMPPPVPWADLIGPRDLWSDDAGDAAYNLPVRAPYGGSHERLRRADPMYDLVIVTDWNWPEPIPGRGSAIFVHQWRRPLAPTAGCLGLRRDHLHWIAQRLVPGSRIVT